ncbi:hypothetical protein ACFWV1_25395 [Streptomyces sp. NPDC058700]|uniref:hypothetical protein n=1 Tax=Streptomyces sp. NPDC058700 TaxID=3346607 RepID=UPI003662A21A
MLLPLFEAVEQIPVAAEHREGYSRTLYRHWNKGLNGTDSCNTRKEVILAEAIETPQVGHSRMRTHRRVLAQQVRQRRGDRRSPPRRRPHGICACDGLSLNSSSSSRQRHTVDAFS